MKVTPGISQGEWNEKQLAWGQVSRRKFLKAAAAVLAGVTVVGAGGLAYAVKIEPNWIDVVRQTIRLPRLDTAFNGFRLAQLSDIHLSSATTIAEVSDAVRRMVAEKPDLVAITGDFIDDRPTLRSSISALGAELAKLNEQVPVIAILGNHDYRMGAQEIRAMLIHAGITLLDNQVYSLERSGARLHLAGLDDIQWGRPDLSAVLQQIPESGAAILLAHEPDYADVAAAAGRFDLQISGHTHGGQVVLPLAGPLVLPEMGHRYPSGLYQVGQMLQYTNRGLGTTAPHVRFHCRPEITIFTLQAG
ncbi:MAG TPA: metallophosphoesterase [Anaerolineaceae bacterium]